MSLKRAAAYAKPCSDFLDREQFGYCLLAHRSIPHVAALDSATTSFALDLRVGQKDQLD
jgi:hypothetical protein